MLQAPRALGHAVSVGPVGAQARALGEALADRDATAYVGVSLPEEMSVRETLELDDGIAGALGRGLDLVVVDGVYPDRCSDAEASAIEAADRRSGCPALAAAVLSQHRRARMHAVQVRWLRARATAPVVTLPCLFSAELGADGCRRLASLLQSRLTAL
jgi:hypothetical protein